MVYQTLLTLLVFTIESLITIVLNIFNWVWLMVCRVMVLTGEDIDIRAIDDIDAIPAIDDVPITDGDITNALR